MPDTTNNVTFEVFGNTADFATDYGTNGIGFSNSHLQIFKIAYGTPSGANTRVSATNPLPVNISGFTGSLLGITGTIRGTGEFRIINRLVPGTTRDIEYLMVAGTTLGGAIGITGTVEGISGGYPLAISGDARIINAVLVSGVTGAWVTGFGGGTGATAYNPIVVTGGRRLSPAIDEVGVTGTVTINGGRVLAAGTDSIKVFGSDAGTKVLTRLYAGNGDTLGSSGGALNVNVVGTGISANVTLSATVSVTADNISGLVVQGYTAGSGGTPLIVKGENSGQIDVKASTALPVTFSSGITLNADNIIDRLGTGDNGILKALNNIDADTNLISTLDTRLTNSYYSVKVAELTKPSSFVASSVSVTSTTGATQLKSNSSLKSGVTIKASTTNSDVIYVGSISLSRNVINGYPLDPGESVFLEINNLNLIYIRTTSGTQSVSYIGS